MLLEINGPEQQLILSVECSPVFACTKCGDTLALRIRTVNSDGL